MFYKPSIKSLIVCISVIILCTNGVLSFSIPGAISTTVVPESSENEVATYDFPFTTRSQWKARPARQRSDLNVPVPYVVIHHSYIPKACNTSEDCCQAMRSMQDFHMDDRKWWDIGYNFAVGSRGDAYEGRGWTTLGAHSLHFNSISIGIVLIGDWSENLPPSDQLKTAKSLIATGVELGFIKPDYKIVGHRQVRQTECPGEALFKEIKTWPHWSAHPSSVLELVDVKELPKSIKSKLDLKSA